MNLKKMIKMKTKSYFQALVMMVPTLLLIACSNNDDVNRVSSQTQIIPYTVSVNSEASTRATVDADFQTLKFASGDKLYVSGTNISGVMDIQTGMGTASATFSGSLTYTGSGSPADNLALTATLVSAQQNPGTEVTVATDNTVTVNYGTALCADVNEAVQKYSLLTGTSTYAQKSFSLTQQTAFLNFAITLVDGTTVGTDVSATVANVGGSDRTGTVATVADGTDVVAKFVAPVAKQALSGASVTVGSNAAFAFGESKVLAAKVYNLNRKIVNLSAVTEYEAQDGDILTGTGVISSHITIADNAIITLNGVNLTTIGTTESYLWPGLDGKGDCTLILEGSNYVRGGYDSCPGIRTVPGKTLTIRGNGSLEVSGNSYGVGIGGNRYTSSYDWPCGNIRIEGGTIIANGGWSMAGIGGQCGNITITGGNVTATGGAYAAGIGTSKSGNCGNILISGGTVNANGGGSYSVGIGGAGDDSYSHGTCGTITITNGVTKVTAKGANKSIGADGEGVCGTITVGGEVMTSFTNPYTYQPD